MHRTLRRIGFAAAVVVVGIYVVLALRGPQGAPALLEKRQTIRTMQEQNADLDREIARRRERIRRLQDNPAEQELEIRRRLKLLRPGETDFILPGPAKPAGGAQAVTMP